MEAEFLPFRVMKGGHWPYSLRSLRNSWSSFLLSGGVLFGQDCHKKKKKKGTNLVA